MSQDEPPRRARLADHVLARRHLTDGGERVVLHDARTGRLVVLGPREWGLLACADGTRDAEGIVRAAARAGAHARAPALRAFLAQLAAAGLVVEGDAPEADPDEAPPPAPDAPQDQPLDVLPDFSLRCDGRGSCCRLYATVLFAPVEAARARAALPEILDGGADPGRVFLPERGAGPCAGSAVAMVDGRCAYLAASGRCAVHEAAGEAAKPLGCRLFPATFADDGERVRVSVAVECACVLASVGLPGGGPLLPGAPRSRGDLDPALDVAVVPPRVRIHAGATAPRGELVTWSRRVCGAPAPEDAPSALWALAAAVEDRGLDPAAAHAALGGAGPLGPAEVAPWAGALAARAGRRADEDASWRSASDLTRAAARWIADAADALRAPDVARAALAARGRGPAEAFYVRAAVHGHQLVGAAPLAVALRDRAVRILVARVMALGAAGRIEDPAGEHPLALVEAVLRGHGLGAYVGDVLP